MRYACSKVKSSFVVTVRDVNCSRETNVFIIAWLQEVMNRLDTAMRVACRDPELNLVTRLYILELVELRQNSWNLNENILSYYRQKLAQASRAAS
jgi:hypothetical protein